tara:strand:+ start:5734 stop:5907 length:174 start_codon:yes stop_codon:yes gene_type:complete
MSEYNYDLYYDFEEAIVKIIKRFTTKNRRLLNFKFKGYDLERLCLDKLHGVMKRYKS